MGLVYPHIDIKDTEEASLLQFDATDNTVLITIPYARRYYIEESNVKWDPEEDLKKIKPTLYTDVNDFIADWNTGAGEWSTVLDENGETEWKEAKDKTPRYCFGYNLKYYTEQDDKITYNVIYTPEKSYLMARELIKMGLPVLVRPIPVKYADSTVDADGHIIADAGAVPSPGDGVLFDTTEKVVFAKHSTFLLAVNEAVSDDPDVGQCLDDFVDKNMYSIKFITTGAYENIGTIDTEGGLIYNSNVYNKLTDLAVSRGDAIALLEFRENILSKEELTEELNSADLEDLSAKFDKFKYAAAFTPWCEFTISKSLPTRVMGLPIADREKAAKKYNLSALTTMPACFAYLMAYAYSIRTNATWWAAAGVTRGQIPQLVKPLFEIGESFMHLLQGKDASTNYEYNKIRLNPIMNTGSYGYRIWGNRVAGAFKDLAGVYKTMYSEFLNVRMLLCDIKKQIYTAAMRTTFEPNDDITWISFKVLCSNLLDRMKSGRGLLWYKWTKEVSEERATIKAKLTVRPIEAVEHFDITVFLSDQDAEVEE